jgi:hypothetical protein
VTLILSALTHDHAVQVSDRRLVNIHTGSVEDDKANKAVIFCGRLQFGYTGLASIGDAPTDRWLATLLCAPGLNLQRGLRRVADEATAAFKRIRLPSAKKRHAFVGVGWSQPPPGSEYVPVLCVVSNFTNTRAEEAPQAQEDFRVDITRLDPRQNRFIFPAGQPLLPEEVAALRLHAGTVVKRAGAVALAELLAKTVRHVAARNRAVGASLMVGVIPKAAVPVDTVGVPPQLSEDRAAWVYVPSTNEVEHEYYMPAWACPVVGEDGSSVGVAIADVKIRVEG